jgi:hypothetical protein
MNMAVDAIDINYWYRCCFRVFEFVLQRRLRCLILRKEVLFVIRIILYWFQIIKDERTSLNC